MTEKKRTGLATNPLDMIVPRSDKQQAQQREEQSAEPKAKRERYTMTFSSDLMDRAKNASWSTRDPLSTICERAIEAEVVKLEKANGGAFPERPSPNLQAGRRLS